MKKLLLFMMVFTAGGKLVALNLEDIVEKTNQSATKYCLSFKQEREGDDYEIDKFGRVVSITSDSNSDGIPEKKVFQSYDEHSNLIKFVIEVYQEREKLYEETILGLGYSLGKYQTVPTYRTQTINLYDSENRLLEKLEEGTNHSIRRRYRYADKPEATGVRVFLNDKLAWDYDIINTYDAEGRLSSMALKGLVYNSILIDTNNEHKNEAYIYNDKGELTKRESLDKSWFYSYIYDAKGNRIQETFYQRNDKGSYRKRFNSIFYKYDDYGNMIEKSDDSGAISLKQEFEECKYK